MRFALLTIIAAMLSLSAVAEEAEPLAQAHAHNDYEHARPLFDALEHGFTSVEADIWLVDGALLVAHDEADLKPGRTLQSLYLDPLKARATKNGGNVYRAGDRFTLLIDIKSEGEATYAELERVLSAYPDLLTVYSNGEARPGAVTAIISGNRPRETMMAASVRHAGYDGRMSDLDGDAPATFMPLVSDNWTKTFTWQGVGQMPEAERTKLKDIVETSHGKGRLVRFWATPDAPGPERDAVWSAMRDAGVDLINTDDLAGLQAFLRKN